MGLFNNFKDTIFLKEDSNLEKQIEDLKSIPNYDKNTNIIRDIKLLEWGLQGEKEIAFELKHANVGMYVLHDITLIYEDLKAQIDYIIITKGYTYLVECKNLIGNITVDSKGEFKREYSLNKKSYVEAIYSPYTQAVRHKDILKKRWRNNHSKLVTMINENSFDKLWYKPLVVLANSKSLLETKYAPKEIKDCIIRADQLVRYIENDLKNYDKDLLGNKKSMLVLANKILDANVNEYKSIASKYQVDYEDLIKNLKNYRLEKSRREKIPAYYIFTDKELENLIKFKISTMEDLRKSKILSEIKIKCHGNEIINIINSYK